MFYFVVKYLGFLKHVPGMALLFDVWLKMGTLITRPQVLDYMDEIEGIVLKWPQTTKSLHKYGGVQFNYNCKEIGHIHGNGLLDIRLSRKLKQLLLRDGKIFDHHVFTESGWISFYINTHEDMLYALELLRIAYHRNNKKQSLAPCRDHHAAVAPVITVLT